MNEQDKWFAERDERRYGGVGTIARPMGVPDDAEASLLVTTDTVKVEVDPNGREPSDNVLRPSHYASRNIECIDAIRAALGDDNFIAYCRGNVIKYLWRADLKGKRGEDIAKAKVYAGWADDAARGQPLQKGRIRR